ALLIRGSCILSPLSSATPCACFSSHRAPLVLPSFPTRRSSDLADRGGCGEPCRLPVLGKPHRASHRADRSVPQPRFRRDYPRRRSEEHTSELQSHLNLVCRLLLEKKKTTITHEVLSKQEQMSIT